MKGHDQDAPIEGAMRADAMLDKGDLDGLHRRTYQRLRHQYEAAIEQYVGG